MGTEGSQRLNLKVEGMDCANCALGITRRLVRSGDHDVHVDFTTAEASLILAPHRKEEDVIADIESLGYKVVDANGKSKTGGLSLSTRFWICLGFSLPLMITHIIPGLPAIFHNAYFQLCLVTPVFLIGSWHFGRSAWNSLRSGIPNMDVLIITGILTSFGYSIAGMILYGNTHEVHNYLFFETTGSIITLVLLGNLFEQRSVKKTSSAIGDLAALLPDKARRIVTIGKSEREEIISPDLLFPGDVVQVNAGESFPADGIVVSGAGNVNEAMLTGESTPVGKPVDASVIGGSVLLDGPIRFRVTTTGQKSTLSQIIEMVKAAQREKPPVQKLADKISAWFVPAVLAISAATFLIEYFALQYDLQQSIMNAIAVLVISCPCAMGLATPTAVMVGVGRAAKLGILIRSGKTLEELGNIQTVVFDKTGTLTTGNFTKLELQCRPGVNETEVREVLWSLEKQSAHPIAASIIRLMKEQNGITLSDVREEMGIGISGKDAAQSEWKVGSWRIAQQESDKHDLFILKNGIVVAAADLYDEIKSGAAETVAYLHSRNIQVVLLSGDRKEKCAQVASTLGIREVYAEQLPQEKLDRITAFSAKGKTIMVGDGINDAPSLSRANVGISLSDASKAALNSAHVIVPGENNLLVVKTAIEIGRKSMQTIRQNLFWAFFYNVVAIPIAAAGFLTPMVAALSMAFSDVIVIGNSLLLRTKKLK